MGILDVTGHYRLIRTFLSGFLAVAALDVQQECRLLLTSGYNGECRRTFQATAASVPNGTNHLEVTLNNHLQHHSDGMPGTVPGNDIRSRLDRQERRAHDAELLLAAAGAISASLDASITLNKTAEQATHLLTTRIRCYLPIR